MEPRGQEKDSIPTSMSYNPSSLNHESSAKVASAPAVSTLPERRRNESSRLLGPNSQTLDQTNLVQQHQPPHPLQMDCHDKDLNPDPDPAQVTNATTTSASDSKIQSPSQPPPPPPPPPQPAASATSNSSASVRYRECLKNHAASMGGHVVDGCGEFMPSGEEGTPEALRCAACDCHRNFHRKESDGDPQTGTSSYYTTQTHSRHNSAAPHSSLFRTQPQPSLLTMPPQQQHHKYSHSYSHGFTTNPTAPIMMAFGGSGGAPAESSSEDLNMFQYEVGAQGATHQSFLVSRKRYRTKFTQQQKDRMHEFAEKLGWKIQKQDEQEVQQFCDEVGVKRKVFKVWMHNNKQAMKKKQM